MHSEEEDAINDIHIIDTVDWGMKSKLIPNTLHLPNLQLTTIIVIQTDLPVSTCFSL